jgi:hypothetical protein
MTDIPEHTPPQASDAKRRRRAGSNALVSRRRIAAAGLAAPVVLSFSSRAALATGGHGGWGDEGKNCTVSGWVELGVSVAPSGMTHRTNCGGKDPSYWYGKGFSGRGEWDSQKCRHKNGVKFTAVFNGVPPVAGYTLAYDYLLGDVFKDIRGIVAGKDKDGAWYKPENHPPFQDLAFAAHAVAMYLNALSGYVEVDPEQIKMMFISTYAASGPGYPVAGTGVMLTKADVLQFWMSTYWNNAAAYPYQGAMG